MNDDPLAEYKFQDGPLAGQYQQSIEELYESVAIVAYHSTPGAQVKDYHDAPNGPFLRPVTEQEAAKSREEFEKLSRQLQAREPKVYAIWWERYLDWESGDMSKRLVCPDAVAAELKAPLGKG